MNNSKRSSKGKIFLIVLFTVIFSLLLQLYRDNYTFEVTTYRVSYEQYENRGMLLLEKSGGFSENYHVGTISSNAIESIKGIKIVQISDLHNMDYKTSLIDAIDKISPDFIFFTGDLVSASDRSFDGFYNLIEAVGPKYKCYFVPGNHDNALPKSCKEEIKAKLLECGVVLLNGDKVEILPNVFLYGLNYDSDYYRKGSTYSVDQMIKDIGEMPSENCFNILIAHDPNNFLTYSSWGADLVFSGHTHGGMVRLFGRGLFASDGSLYPNYAGGIFIDTVDHENTNAIIVSRGLSRGCRGFRLFNTPELVVVEF